MSEPRLPGFEDIDVTLTSADEIAPYCWVLLQPRPASVRVYGTLEAAQAALRLRPESWQAWPDPTTGLAWYTAYGVPALIFPEPIDVRVTSPEGR